MAKNPIVNRVHPCNSLEQFIHLQYMIEIGPERPDSWSASDIDGPEYIVGKSIHLRFVSVLPRGTFQ